MNVQTQIIIDLYCASGYVVTRKSRDKRWTILHHNNTDIMARILHAKDDSNVYMLTARYPETLHSKRSKRSMVVYGNPNKIKIDLADPNSIQQIIDHISRTTKILS